MSKSQQPPIGAIRFQTYLEQLKPILEKADASKDPATVLYKGNARTPLFMLEALSRVYERIHNKKTFGKLREHFKLLEDMLGSIDYYDAFHAQLKGDKKVPAAILRYLRTKTTAQKVALNDLLKDKGWIGNDNERIGKIEAKLRKADWLDEEQDALSVKRNFQKAIDKVVDDIKTHEINFDNVEEDVHELRRELRWLSIYAQCFKGLFQLRPAPKATTAQKKYLTPEIVNSPFNQMPPKGDLKYTIELDKNNFLALSWMIAELGKLKDNGLKVVVLTEAIKAGNNKLTDKQATDMAYKMCGKDQLSLDAILQVAKQESDRFFSEALLEHLLVS